MIFKKNTVLLLMLPLIMMACTSVEAATTTPISGADQLETALAGTQEVYFGTAEPTLSFDDTLATSVAAISSTPDPSEPTPTADALANFPALEGGSVMLKVGWLLMEYADWTTGVDEICLYQQGGTKGDGQELFVECIDLTDLPQGYSDFEIRTSEFKLMLVFFVDGESRIVLYRVLE